MYKIKVDLAEIVFEALEGIALQVNSTVPEVAVGMIRLDNNQGLRKGEDVYRAYHLRVLEEIVPYFGLSKIPGHEGQGGSSKNMRSIEIILPEFEYDEIAYMAVEMRCKIEQAATGVILHALSENKGIGGISKTFIADVLREVVLCYDHRKFPARENKDEIRLKESVIDAIDNQAERRDESIDTYLTRLIERDMDRTEAQEPETALAGAGATGREERP